jgi:hypothetical protein
LALSARECQIIYSSVTGGRRILPPGARVDEAPMSEPRTSAIGAAAAILVAALWAPWYAIDFGPAARSAIGAQTDNLPGVMGDVARQLLTILPTHIEATAWQAFDKADVILLACAIAAVFAALLHRMDVAGIAGAVAAGTVVVAMADRPGPSELISLKWGAWLGLAAALAIVGASRMGTRRALAPTAPAPAPDWTKPAADPAQSFPPF